jgi:hypothetical protein
MVLVIGVVAWQTMPIPDRIEPGVMRRGMLHGLAFALLVGIVGSIAALYLIARAFASFTGW